LDSRGGKWGCSIKGPQEKKIRLEKETYRSNKGQGLPGEYAEKNKSYEDQVELLNEGIIKEKYWGGREGRITRESGLRRILQKGKRRPAESLKVKTPQRGGSAFCPGKNVAGAGGNWAPRKGEKDLNTEREEIIRDQENIVGSPAVRL